MLVIGLAGVVLCSVVAAAPAPVTVGAVADTTIATMTDTVQPVMTAEGLAKMTAFLSNYMKSPQGVKDSAMKMRIMVPLGTVHVQRLSNSPKLPSVNAPDMVSLAKTNATVAAQFKAAGLTPEEYMQWRRALMIAAITNNTDQAVNGAAGALDTTTTVGKNAYFMKTHQQEVAALTATGFQFPQIQLRLTPNAPATGGSDLLP
jgi:hypothetical protein